MIQLRSLFARYGATLCLTLGLGLAAISNAHAECGGKQECIAVTIDGSPPAHGTPLVSEAIAFGTQAIGTTSGSRTITVAAVTGPAGSSATLNSITITGAQAAQFSLVGGTCSTGVPNLPHGGASCSVLVAFNPSSAGPKNAAVAIATTAITRTVPLTGTGIVQPPLITSALAATGIAGVVFGGYQITATNDPTSFSAAPLPSGLSVDGAGHISGTPTMSQTVNTTITATNAAGTDTATLVFTISENAPIITSASSITGTAGVPIAPYQIAATNNPTSFEAVGLPPGLSVDTTSGVISGTPTQGGTSLVTLSATNATATGTQIISVVIDAVAPSSQDHAVDVPLNTATPIDLAPFIAGVGTLTVRVVDTPAHGGVTVDGTVVTYAPVAGYFGADSFNYVAVASDGESSPSRVNITVVGRPDPTVDATTRALVRSQMEVAKRFSRSQISNFQRRLETLRARRSRRAPATSLTPAMGSLSAAALADAPAQAPEPPQAEDSQAFGFAGGQFSSLLADSVLPLLSNGSIDLANSFNGAGSALDGSGVWVGGNVKFGTRDAADGADALRFTSDGVSLGIDRWFTSSLALGIGLGYATGNSDIGSNGTESEAEAWSVSAYASYQPTANIYIDGLLGYGDLEFDVERHVSAVNAFAHSDRDGDQVFGSFALGYDYRYERLLVSPYGRFDFAFSWLDRTSETGAGQNALTYFDDSMDTGRLALGLRIESAHEMRFGWVMPRLRVEYRHEFEGERRSTMAYADQAAGPRFVLDSDGVNKDALLLSMGSDFDFGNGVTFGLDYETLQFAGADEEQAIGLWLARDFDAAPLNFSGFARRLFNNPIRIETSYAWDDNLNRVHHGRDKIEDHVFDAAITQRYKLPLGTHVRLLIDPSISGQKLYEQDGLDRLSAGIGSELQYRTSGDFYAPTFSAFALIRGDNFRSHLRDGYRYAYGVKAQRAITDRIGAYSALERTVRSGENRVWDMKDYALKLTFDYALPRWGVIYAGGQFRRGDMVSSFDSSSVYYHDLAKADVIDDAYPGVNLEAARYEAETWLFTLGYNLPLGPRDSLDFSWRRAQSCVRVPGYLQNQLRAVGFEDNYAANRLSVAYLMRF